MANTYEAAIKALSEQDFKRIVCVFLNSTNATTDWEKATADFGSASVNSMRVSMGKIMRKVHDAAGNDSGAASTATTPTPKKRKGKGKVDDDDNEETPVPKKRGRASKKGKVNADDGKDIAIKSEVKGEIEDEDNLHNLD